MACRRASSGGGAAHIPDVRQRPGAYANRLRPKSDGVMTPSEYLHSVGVKCPANPLHTRITGVPQLLRIFWTGRSTPGTR